MKKFIEENNFKRIILKYREIYFLDVRKIEEFKLKIVLWYMVFYR